MEHHEGKRPRTTLHTLYQGLIDTKRALQAARLTGTFILAANAERAKAQHTALQECARVKAEIARLTATAAREKQILRLD